MSKLLVIGGGITSAVTSALIAEQFNVSSNKILLNVWDKARGYGGRMATSRSPKNPQCTLDLGAQFIHARTEHQKDHRNIYEEMIQQRLIHPIVKYKTDINLVKYVAPNGSASIVKHFFQKSGIAPSFKHHIDQIKITSNNHIEISTQNGEKDIFQAAILTMPTPQIINLPGMDSILSSEVTEKLSNVQYHSRYALGLFYENDEQFLNGNNFIPDIPGFKKFYNSIFSYVSHDPRKRGKPQEKDSSVVFLTSHDFGEKFVDTPIPEVEEILLKETQKYLPTPNSVKCQRWRYSQVKSAYEGCPKAVILNENPLIIAGGDGFVSNNAIVDDCIVSAYKIANILSEKLP